MKIDVPGVGPVGAKIALVGEQPGKSEVLYKTPFVGPAGKELNKCLIAVGISRAECYITNTIKTLSEPLQSFIDMSGRSVVTTEKWNECVEWLKDELIKINPNVVAAFGNVALYALCSRTGITKWRGSVIESSLIRGMKVVPTVHPATILPPKNVYMNKYLITFDLRKARCESETKSLPIEDWNLIINPSFDRALEFLELAYEAGLAGATVDFDIEVVKNHLECFSMTYDGFNSICVNMWENYGTEKEARLLLALAKIIEDDRIVKRGQNICFDLAYLLNKFGIKPRGKFHDTMIAQKISAPDFPAGLDFITSVHTNIPYYKGEGKQWLKIGGDIDKFRMYSALDALATSRANKALMNDIKATENETTYERHCRLIPVLVYMQERGIRVAVDKMEAEREKVKALIAEKEEELFSLTGYRFNYNSPKQVAEYFYEKKGLAPYKKKTSRGYSITCDVDALVRIARGTVNRKGLKEASLIMELRTLTTKHLGTYLTTDNIDSDGRYRSQYNPVGTVTGRLSSSKNIFGTGGNQQNWPHSLLKFLVADPGYICYSIDLSQAENRIVAYVGRVTEMIEAFESGVDVHRLTAALIFGKRPDEISDEDGSCSLGDGTHSERYWGKKGNHSLNYDISYYEFGLKNELPEHQAKWIIEQYHKAYPGVRQNYHAMIREQLAKNRTIENLMGRKRLFLGEWGRDLFKEAYAHIPQSTVADIINERGLLFLWDNYNRFKHVDVLRQVHDDIGFQIPVSCGFTYHAEALLALCKSLETPLEFHKREFVIPVDITFGLSFSKSKGECKEIKHSKRPASVEQLAKLLEEGYEELKRVAE